MKELRPYFSDAQLTVDQKRQHIQSFQRGLTMLRTFEQSDHLPRTEKNPAIYAAIRHEGFSELITNPNVPKDGSAYINKQKVGTILDHLGLDAESVMSSWDSSHSDLKMTKPRGRARRNQHYIDNFVQIAALEARRPGITKTLHDEFNIKTFARYPENLLIDQYDNRNNKDTPYAIALFPRDDHNGVFYRDLETLDTIHKGTQGDLALRIYEVEDGQYNLAKTLIKADRRYWRNGNRKIGGVFIFGHGDTTSIQFGEDKFLTTNDTFFHNEEWQAYFEDFFAKNANFIFVSCSTGEPDAIAQQIGHKLNRSTVAPDGDIAVADIQNVGKKDGKILFEVAYDKGVAANIFAANDKNLLSKEQIKNK